MGYSSPSSCLTHTYSSSSLFPFQDAIHGVLNHCFPVSEWEEAQNFFGLARINSNHRVHFLIRRRFSTVHESGFQVRPHVSDVSDGLLPGERPAVEDDAPLLAWLSLGRRKGENGRFGDVPDVYGMSSGGGGILRDRPSEELVDRDVGAEVCWACDHLSTGEGTVDKRWEY